MAVPSPGRLCTKQASEHIPEAWGGTSWIVEVMAVGTRDGKALRQTHLFLHSLRTTPDALVMLVGLQSIRSGIQAMSHFISQLLAMARRQPEAEPC